MRVKTMLRESFPVTSCSIQQSENKSAQKKPRKLNMIHSDSRLELFISIDLKNCLNTRKKSSATTSDLETQKVNSINRH